MKPTIQEMNVAIAEMIGLPKSMASESVDSEIQTDDDWERYDLTDFDIVKDYVFQSDFCTAEDLMFDQRADWQFEAIDWIEKQGYFTVLTFHPKLRIHSFEISEGRNVIAMREGNSISKKEAIFEALYQFSQYIKSKK
jgi:hypothetical protein